MSLLADLLSKVKYVGLKGDVPPNLKQVVADSAERTANVKKAFFITALMVAAVITGFGAVYVAQTFLRPVSAPPPVSLPQPGSVQAPPAAVQAPQAPVPVAASSSPEAPAPVKREHKKTPSKDSLSAKRGAEPEQEGKYKSSVIKPPAAAEPEYATKEQKQTGQLSVEDNEKRDMYLYAAKASESRKDYQHALANYMKVLEIDPGSPGNYIIMNNIAGIMIERGFYDEAQHYAGNSLNLKQDYVPSLVNMGIASFKLNNTADGEKYLAKALSLDPSNKYALINLALIHEKVSEYDKAYPLYYKLAGLGDIRGYFGLARIQEKKGKNQEAARIYREILSMNNIDPALKKSADEKLSQLEQR